MKTKLLLGLSTILLLGGCATSPSQSSQTPIEFTKARPSTWSPTAAAPNNNTTITWRVKDRYRLFDEADNVSKAKIEDLLSSLSGTSPIRSNYDKLLASLSGPEAAELRRSNFGQVELDNGNKSYRYDEDYLKPLFYTVEISAKEYSSTGNCNWSFSYPAETSQLPELITHACSETLIHKIPASWKNDRWGGYANVSLLSESKPERPISSMAISINDVLIVAMGDSFISGEGNPDQPSDFSAILDQDFFENNDINPKVFARPTWPGNKKVSALVQKNTVLKKAVWWDEPCHRSLLSWPVLASLKLAANNDQQAVTLVHLGCSGTLTDEGVYGPQEGLPGGGEKTRASQVSQLDALNKDIKRPIDRMLLSTGGNDVRFAGAISYLAIPPNGYFGPDFLMARVVAKSGGVVRPFINDSGVHKNFGKPNGPPIEELMSTLPSTYKELSANFDKLGISDERVFQPQYPNPLRAALIGPIGEKRVDYCRSAISQDDLDEWRKYPDDFGNGDIDQRIGAEEAYLNAYYDVRPTNTQRDGGFEALAGTLPKLITWRTDWNFQMVYYPNNSAKDGCEYQASSPTTANAGDSEVCKAQWVFTKLNEGVAQNGNISDGKHAWNIIDGHLDGFENHGWCGKYPEKDLVLPIYRNGAWQNPSLFLQNAYDENLPRWFRTANDSAVMQYTNNKHYYQGVIHPTFNAHIAYAQAVYEEAFE